jgi:hypothetical protein
VNSVDVVIDSTWTVRTFSIQQLEIKVYIILIMIMEKWNIYNLMAGNQKERHY